MAPAEAEDARLLTRYGSESAGGLMITEFLAFYESMTIDDILRDLRANNDAYQTFDVQYVYIIDADGLLRGVVRLRDLVMTAGYKQAQQIMIENPLHVTVDTELEQLESFFDKYSFYALPVVDPQHHMMGVVRRSSVEEALADRTERSLLKFGGIVGGEELRATPIWGRIVRRFAFLAPNIGLNLAAVSVIAIFEPTIEQMTALAIFLPLISDMGGNAGIQAIAVSMRELWLGVFRAGDALFVVGKELSAGIFTGLLLGLIGALIASAMRHEAGWILGAVVAFALMANNLVAVGVGGVLPLLLRRLGLDPAMASGPILTTITDLCGFFFALGLATLLLQYAPALTG